MNVLKFCEQFWSGALVRVQHVASDDHADLGPASVDATSRKDTEASS